MSLIVSLQMNVWIISQKVINDKGSEDSVSFQISSSLELWIN